MSHRPDYCPFYICSCIVRIIQARMLNKTCPLSCIFHLKASTQPTMWSGVLSCGNALFNSWHHSCCMLYRSFKTMNAISNSAKSWLMLFQQWHGVTFNHHHITTPPHGNEDERILHTCSICQFRMISSSFTFPLQIVIGGEPASLNYLVQSSLQTLPGHRVLFLQCIWHCHSAFSRWPISIWKHYTRSGSAAADNKSSLRLNAFE